MNAGFVVATGPLALSFGWDAFDSCWQVFGVNAKLDATALSPSSGWFITKFEIPQEKN